MCVVDLERQAAIIQQRCEARVNQIVVGRRVDTLGPERTWRKQRQRGGRAARGGQRTGQAGDGEPTRLRRAVELKGA